MKFIKIEYNANLKNWDIKQIKGVKKIYSQVLRGIKF